MSDVTRYVVRGVPNEKNISTATDPEGPWVHYDDYARLRAERDELWNVLVMLQDQLGHEFSKTEAKAVDRALAKVKEEK